MVSAQNPETSGTVLEPLCLILSFDRSVSHYDMARFGSFGKEIP
jgi:hypothetical protein